MVRHNGIEYLTTQLLNGTTNEPNIYATQV